MDPKLFATVFATVFLAELGDKTQLATLTLSATAGSRWTVFAGAALALILSSGIAVVVGQVVTLGVSPALLRRLAGVIFIAIGVTYLLTGR